jgi:hypothetical protein
MLLTVVVIGASKRQKGLLDYGFACNCVKCVAGI